MAFTSTALGFVNYLDGLNYDYTASKTYCEGLGLVWIEDLVKEADAEAYRLDFTQAQVDAAMRHHLWQVKFLFSPKTYNWLERIGLALHFLFGR